MYQWIVFSEFLKALALLTYFSLYVSESIVVLTLLFMINIPSSICFCLLIFKIQCFLLYFKIWLLFNFYHSVWLFLRVSFFLLHFLLCFWISPPDFWLFHLLWYRFSSHPELISLLHLSANLNLLCSHWSLFKVGLWTAFLATIISLSWFLVLRKYELRVMRNNGRYIKDRCGKAMESNKNLFRWDVS